MKLYEVSDYREPEAEPAVLSRGRAVGLSEEVEDVREEVRVNPRARVRDSYLNPRVRAGGRRDAARVRSKGKEARGASAEDSGRGVRGGFGFTLGERLRAFYSQRASGF